MNLETIKKIIAEADFVYVETLPGYVVSAIMVNISEPYQKKSHFQRLEETLQGNELFYYKREKETGKMTLIGKVKNIDNKRRVKDLSWEEVTAICNERQRTLEQPCEGCVFYNNELRRCWWRVMLDESLEEVEVPEHD